MGKILYGAGWFTKRWLIVGSCALFVIVAGVGLGTGLGVGLRKDDDGGDDNDDSPKRYSADYGSNVGYWQPKVGAKWQIELLYPLNDTSPDVDVFDIDVFDNDKQIISDLQKDGKKVICYFSAGTYEEWRDDANEFKDDDLGDPLEEWDGERWLQISSDDVRTIMKKRLDVAKDKGCDGVDPDNVDGYDNKNGLGLSKEDSIDYVNFLAKEAHSRNLSIGLKNAGDIISSVIDQMQWSVNEQCVQEDECDIYSKFTDNHKPVFHIEYPKGDDTNDNNPVSDAQKKKACEFYHSHNFSTLIKNMNLDNWVQNC
jgi:endo-alpha-1,4-polygalactosaminidase (GH114 family)